MRADATSPKGPRAGKAVARLKPPTPPKCTGATSPKGPRIGKQLPVGGFLCGEKRAAAGALLAALRLRYGAWRELSAPVRRHSPQLPPLLFFRRPLLASRPPSTQILPHRKDQFHTQNKYNPQPAKNHHHPNDTTNKINQTEKIIPIAAVAPNRNPHRYGDAENRAEKQPTEMPLMLHAPIIMRRECWTKQSRRFFQKIFFGNFARAFFSECSGPAPPPPLPNFPPPPLPNSFVQRGAKK